MNRRDFLCTTAGVAAFLGNARNSYPFAQSAPLQKWAQRIRGVTEIPISAPAADPVYGAAVDFHQIEIVEYADTLHPDLPPTTLWGYNPLNPLVPGVTKRHLGGLIVAEKGKAVRLRATNGLPARHILPVDPTVDGGNLAQNRTTVHLHGGLVPWISDGGPFTWFGPNLGDSFANTAIPGSLGGTATADYYYPNQQSARLAWYHDHSFGITRLNAYAGIASGYLITDPVERAAFGSDFPGYLGIPIVFQDKIFTNPATMALLDPTWGAVTRPNLPPMGSLWYPHIYDPKLYKLLRTKALALPDPSCVPEFFGDTMLVNGTVYPRLDLQPGTHRLRILNACSARFMNLNLFVADAANPDGITLNARTQFPINAPGPVMTMVASEGGWLTKPVLFPSPAPFNPATMKGNLILGPGERADVLITIPAAPVGAEYILYNDAPSPFPMGAPTNDYYLGNPKNPVQPAPGAGPDTRQVMRIRVTASGLAPRPTPNLTVLQPEPQLPVPVPAAPLAPVAPLAVPALNAVLYDGAAVKAIRDLTLNEAFDLYGRLTQLLGTATPQAAGGFGQPYMNPATEVAQAGSWEVWRIFNTTADTHPMHFHLVNVQVLQRQPFQVKSFKGAPNFTALARGPELEELGWKETVKMHPGECTTILMKFDLPVVPFPVPASPRTGGNEYVWHCHILEHEEHDMMRPLVVI